MGIKKMDAIQTMPIFLILLLSSCLAARRLEYKDSPSPAPAESESDAKILCNRASLSALEGVRNVSRAVSNLRVQPSENFSASLLREIGQCLDSLLHAEYKIRKAIEEGPKQSTDYYEPSNRYEATILQVRMCGLGGPATHELLAATNLAVALLSSARELCF